jgi:hypothetical protein
MGLNSALWPSARLVLQALAKVKSDHKGRRCRSRRRSCERAVGAKKAYPFYVDETIDHLGGIRLRSARSPIWVETP